MAGVLLLCGVRRRVGPARPHAAQRHGADVVAGLAVDVDLQAVFGQPLDQALAPLDDRHRLLQRRVEVEVVHLQVAAEPVGVGVDQRRATAERRVDAGDDERGRGDRPPHLEPFGDALHGRGLPGAERARQDQQVAGAEQGGQPRAVRAGLLGGAQLHTLTLLIRSRSASVTAPGRSSWIRWEVSGTSVNWALGSASAIARLWSGGVSQSLSPTMIAVGTGSRTCSADSLSWFISAG